MNSPILHVVAFDPGETTGYCVMGVRPDVLEGTRHVNDKMQDKLVNFDYGEINCKQIDPRTAEDIAHKHAGLNVHGENLGVIRMVDLVKKYSTNINIPCAVVLEDFILDPSKATMGRELLTPVRLISSFSYATRDFKNSAFIQNRSPVKTTCTNDRLRHWGLYDEHSGPHARDATRHAFYFLRNCRGNSIKAREFRWRAWPSVFNDPVVQDIKNAYYRREEDKQKRRGTRVEGLG